jgi:hypothetical protein
MKQCPYCNAQIADNSKFCGECGKELPQENVCTHCGVTVNEGDIYCEECGRNLKDGTYASAEYGEKSGIDYMKILLSSLIGVVIGLVILSLIGGSWYGYNAYSEYSADKQAREKFVADSLEQVRKDSIKLAEQKEQARKDSIENARILSLQKPYLTLLEKYNVKDDNWGKLYFLYDITGDGLPEIWMNIKEGEDFKFCVYSCQNGESKLLFKEDLGYNNTFYYGDNYVLMEYAHMGFQVINKFYLSNNVIKKKKIFETEEAESMNDVEYKEIEEPSITTYELTDRNPIYEIK